MSEEKTIVIPNIKIPMNHEEVMHTPFAVKIYKNIKTGEIKNPEPGIWANQDYEMEIVQPQMVWNFAFYDNLKFESFHNNGNASTWVSLLSTNDNTRFYMFLSEFEKNICDFKNGIITGAFSFMKKGKYYSLYKIEGYEETMEEK